MLRKILRRRRNGNWNIHEWKISTRQLLNIFKYLHKQISLHPLLHYLTFAEQCILCIWMSLHCKYTEYMISDSDSHPWQLSSQKTKSGNFTNIYLHSTYIITKPTCITYLSIITAKQRYTSNTKRFDIFVVWKRLGNFQIATKTFEYIRLENVVQTNLFSIDKVFQH